MAVSIRVVPKRAGTFPAHFLFLKPVDEIAKIDEMPTDFARRGAGWHTQIDRLARYPGRGDTMIELPYGIPTDEEIQRERERRRKNVTEPAPEGEMARCVPASAERLLTLAVERREAILESLRRGEQGVPVRDTRTFARFLRGELTGCFPLPNLERLWNAAHALGLPEVPPWPGEADDSPSAVERLGVLIEWLRKQQTASGEQTPPGDGDAALAVFLTANPTASEDEAAAAAQWTLDRLRKSDVWREHRNNRLRDFYQEHPDAKHTDAAEFMGVARATLSGMSAYQEEEDRRKRNKPPAPARKRGNLSEDRIRQLKATGPRPNDPRRDALHAENYTADGGGLRDLYAFRELLQNLFNGINETDEEYRKIVKRLGSEQIEQLRMYLRENADREEPESFRLIAEQWLDHWRDNYSRP